MMTMVQLAGLDVGHQDSRQSGVDGLTSRGLDVAQKIAEMHAANETAGIEQKISVKRAIALEAAIRSLPGHPAEDIARGAAIFLEFLMNGPSTETNNERKVW